ncbi:hypothetical protein [Streptomyces sp. Ac-502]|uniref:hypothetical protein n=1 Tax=Streptomyces sp. Ac-502 TaxID=3342801 RepID=UPI0038626EE4
MNAGASAAAHAAVVGRGRWWQRALAAAGYVTPGLAQARHRAGNWSAGAEGSGAPPHSSRNCTSTDGRADTTAASLVLAVRTSTTCW